MFEFFKNFTEILLAGILGLWSDIWDFLGSGIQSSIIAVFTFGLTYAFIIRPFMTSGFKLGTGESDTVKRRSNRD